MTLATMADRSLPLAERVLEAIRDAGLHGFQGGTLTELLMDIAAADRLARAVHDEKRTLGGNESALAYFDAFSERVAALDAYRVRMGVGNV